MTSSFAISLEVEHGENVGVLSLVGMRLPLECICMQCNGLERKADSTFPATRVKAVGRVKELATGRATATWREAFLWRSMPVGQLSGMKA